MASSVLYKMMCGCFSEGTGRRLRLKDVDEKAFKDVLSLWYGKAGHVEQDLGYVMVMASVADRLEMLDVLAVLEAAIIGELRPEVCVEVLLSSRRQGLSQVEAAAWGMAVERFDEVSRTAGFMGLDEETLGTLLEEDGLGVRTEEEAFEGLVRWMKGGAGGGLRGRELLGSIRFGVMEKRYLEEKARGMLPEEHREWMDDLLGEALRAKAAVWSMATVELGKLGAKALTRRRGMGVEWGRYIEDRGGRRLKGHSGDVNALVECEGRMCSGSDDGSIRVWRLDTLEEERVLLNERVGGVLALAVWEGQIISGHGFGRVRVWDIRSGERRRELEGHTRSVRSLCVVGSRLASGSADGSIKVWAMGPDREWPCERTLTGHTDFVISLAGWKGKLISGSGESTIRVWDLEAGGLDAILSGHRGPVNALLVDGERLFSASRDGTIRTWAVGTWAALASVEAYDIEDPQFPACLAASGSKVISGSGGDNFENEVRVWDIDSLTCEHTVLQPAGAFVVCLAATGGDVWGGVGWEVVVWGRD